MALLIFNANICTMDSVKPNADSAVILNNRFAYVGNYQDTCAYIDRLPKHLTETVEKLNAKGRFMLPGFNDSHMHFLHYVKSKSSVNLSGSTSINEIISRLSAALISTQVSEGTWLLGEGWNQNHFSGEVRFPTAVDLDRVSKDVPIAIWRACYHAGVLNSKAMELMGLHAQSIKKYGEMAATFDDGTPTGVFMEQALDELKTYMPSPAIKDVVEMILNHQEDLFQFGITSVHSDDFNYVSAGQFADLLIALRDAGQDGRLKLRIAEQALFFNKDDLESFFKDGFGENFGNEHFKLASIKLLTDGSLGARTAYMNRPYMDAPTTRGLPTFTQDELDRLVMTAHSRNMPAVMHAIGDGAIDMCLAAVKHAREAMPQLQPRHGIIHCQITSREQITKFRELDVIAYTQPVFINEDMHIVYDRVGSLGDTSYAWADYQNEGVIQAFGTDCPVENLNPFWGLYCANTRLDLKGRGPYLPDQELSMEDCLNNYTAAGAYCSGEDHLKGQIREGLFADFIFLDRDLLHADKEAVPNTQVMATYIDGLCVWQREEADTG